MEPSNITVWLSTLRQKGNLAYEYNPFYNYQTDVDLYLVDEKYVIPVGQAVNLSNGELLTKKDFYNKTNGRWEYKWIDKRGNIIDNNSISLAESGTLWAKAGSIIDFDTDQLNFDLEHPVEIEVQPSYDGSVNLILNDDKNFPRIINSRFSVREKDTYEIVDRIGENDTNIYNSSSFDKDTSLYFQFEKNPVINYLGFIRGILPVGQYCFYFTYCDADENESDFVAESGLIPTFIGTDKDPFSMDGGIKNQSSDKGIRLRIDNLDKSYDYLRVYYVRYFADYDQNRVYECKKLYQRYPIKSDQMYLHITGYEESEELDPNLLNITRFNPQSILTQAQCKNMLFFGNIVKNTDNYRELSDCALRIVPELISETLSGVNNDYQSTENSYGYYDSNNMYNKVGYFNQEYYRFGIVFIYNNGTLSNVYNTLGRTLRPGDIVDSATEEPFEVNREDLNKFTSSLFNSNKENTILFRNYIKVDDLGWISDDQRNEKNEENEEINQEISGYNQYFLNANSKGVCKIDCEKDEENKILGIKFNIPEKVVNFLKEDLGIRGFFFVRQKCLPNIIAQCFLLPMDDVLQAPIIKYSTNNYVTELFLNKNNKEITNSYESRLYEYNSYAEDSENAISKNAYAAICPDFLLNQPYYNQIFNGSKFRLQKIADGKVIKSDRFYKTDFTNEDTLKQNQVTLCTVTENVQTVAIKNKVYKLEIGKTEEAYRFEYAEKDLSSGDQASDATNLVRGKYSPYIAVYSDLQPLDVNCLYNIYREGIEDIRQEYQNRMDSYEPFYTISNRYNFEQIGTTRSGKVEYNLVCWRGDCYLNTFTYRLNRNFNDPSLPNNDKIIDRNTWKDNYDVNNPEKWADISTSDVNAVQLGSWLTFKVRSATNYALRSVDHSYVAEEALMGAPRSFYPRSQLLWRGENKMPDSYLYNDAYRASLGFKCYFTLRDVNYIKDTFSNRIQYSAIAIQDSFKNNYRYSLSTYFRDYSQEYGSIQKLLGFEGYLLVVFEHAIGVAVVNERVLAGGGDGEPVFINTQNVLPEELTIITDTYGTQWGDSVIKSEAGYVYGVDTIAKKIWRVRGQQIEILSDFKVNKFLIDNITLSERENHPTIGLRNVKTHYNNNKKDIIFTFYDDIYKDEENVWSLCYNELLGAFVTFYSWVPSFSENIDTKFFTFNRDTAKQLALLRKCNYAIPENTGVLLSPPVLKDNPEQQTITSSVDLYYVTTNPSSYINYTIQNNDGTTSIKEAKLNNTANGVGQYIINGVTVLYNDVESQYLINFRLETDHWKNYQLFEIVEAAGKWKLRVKPDKMNEAYQAFQKQKVILLYITPYIQELNNLTTNTDYMTNFRTEIVALTLDSIVTNPLLTQDEKTRAGLTTDFYLHGQAGIFNVVENLYPTYWYGQYHPFEFEFVVNDKVGQQKIFTDLIMISNKAEPESFHFEIEGDNYEFSSDKRNMYFRQEATKNLFQNLGSDVIYNRYYTDVAATKYTYEQSYRAKSSNYYNNYFGEDRIYPIYSEGLTQQVKSTIFPLYYERTDTYNDIYHKYQMMHDEDGVYDFQNLSGSEISWNRDLNQFNIITHIKNRPIDLVGRLRGNSRYKEGKWHVQIPSIAFMQKNEREWPTLENVPRELIEEGPLYNRRTDTKIPPIVINSQNLPEDLPKLETIPNILKENKYIDNSSWSYRKEARIRDKWMKIRVRYSGKNLAIIHSLTTLYNLSYS